MVLASANRCVVLYVTDSLFKLLLYSQEELVLFAARQQHQPPIDEITL